MALADFSAYKTAQARRAYYQWNKSYVTTSNRFSSSWTGAPDAGAAPTTAVALSASTTGALLQQPQLTTTTNPLYLIGAELGIQAGSNQGNLILCDRLSHQGGLSGTTTGAQTTNLPTAALTRFTSGAGVMIGIEVYSAIGSTQTTLTCSYTNTASTAGQTTKAILFGGTNEQNAPRFFICPLADGDSGAKSVESVTIAASTLTAGNFGVVLFKPLCIFPSVVSGTHGMQTYNYDGLLNSGTKMPVVDSAACLFFIGSNGAAGTSIIAGAFNLAEVS